MSSEDREAQEDELLALARAEGGTFGPGTAGWPEGTVGTALRAREAEKSGRAETAQWARAPRILDGASPAGPG